MPDRRAFLASAGAAALALATGLPVTAESLSDVAAIDFDPGDVFDELNAAGLSVWWSRPIGLDAPPPSYGISPRHGGFTQAHLDVMAKWADVLNTCPIRAARMEAWLAAFERGETTPG